MTSIDSRPPDRSDLLRALAVFCEPPGSGHARVARSLDLELPDPADHTELFVHQLVPYASVYVGSEGKIGGEARDRIAGFWRALHLTPPSEPDHLASLLSLMAGISDAERNETDRGRRKLIEHSRQALVWEHLISWLPMFLARVNEVGSDAYRGWGRTVGQVVVEACGDGSTALPSHLELAGPQDPDDVEAWLLVPVVSGLILTRSDLRRAATELGLGLRIGERAYILEALFGQDRSGVIGWLADEAERQAHLWSTAAGPRSVIDRWASRATGTTTLLRAQTLGS